ncbi:MAG: hypothetical protein HN593_10465 [Lentimicrobiaceae bacterium]|jgi:hypothetical protein|nr:hypothetical protein [Lentimicrobiaceae bacterium]MBT6962643.1 hypothetical protein [Lentimicrobiaceae bacterium]MBT7622845.1 hypothetical protein [Lentimicrobiaceae bacterium]
MKIFNYITFSALILCSFVNLNAQQVKSDNSHNEQVTIISSFDPSINQAYKLNYSPDELSFNMDKPEFKYESLNFDLSTQINLKPIIPVVINADKRTNNFNNSIRAGVGSLFSPYFDFRHSSGQRNTHRLDITIYQLSTFKDIKNYSPSPELKAYTDINYRKFLRYHILDFALKYELRSNRFYGFDPDDYQGINISESRLKQSYNLANVSISLRSNYSSNKKLNHSVGITTYYLFDKYNSSEMYGGVSMDLHKSFDLTEMLDYQLLGVEGEVKYYANKDSLKSTNNFLVIATPYFKSNYGKINFKIGLNFNFLSSNSSDFYFYPILDANLSLIDDYLTVYAGVDGNVDNNSILKLSTANPWIESLINTQWIRRFDAYGGIRGNFSQKVNYSAKVSWSKFKNMAFFVNVQDGINPSLPFNKFSAVYDGGSLFSFDGEVTYSASERLSILASIKFYNYSLDSLSKPFNKPSNIVKFGISYMITSKINLWTEVYYYGERIAMNPNINFNTIKLDPFIDLNIGVDYTLAENFSVFLNVTNVLNNNYQRYLYYPVQSIQIMGGITYRF